MTMSDQRSQTVGGCNTIAVGRRADLQGMRAVAVLMVFANHLFDWPPGGFVGVDVFFVLSGFFITGILIRERTTTRKLSFQHFYVRRVKRILPSALLVLVVTVIGSYLLFPAMRAKEALLDALYAALFAANFRFQAVGADYFQADQPPSPLQHYWSLSIEEQFYFVWPFLLVVIFALTRRHSHRGNAWTRQWGLFGAMAVVVAVSFGWAMFLTADDPNGAYFSTFTRVWELGVGALVAIAGTWLARIPSAIRPGLAYLGLAGVLGSMFLIDTTVEWPAPWAALPVLSTALVVASFHGAEVRGMFPLTNPIARYFGDTSYTLYLWHWPVIILLLTVIPRGPLYYGVVLALALGLTAGTYHFYEDPIRKSEWLLDKPAPKRRRMPTLSPSNWAVVGGLMVAVIVVSILGIRYDDKLSSASQDDEGLVVELTAPPPAIEPLVSTASTIVPLTAPLPGKGPCFGAPAILDANCALRNPDVPLTPSTDTFTKDLGTPNCWTGEHEKLKSCTYGYTGDDAIRIALVGDSHASRVLVALAPYLDAMKWKLTTFVGWGCVLKEASGGSCNEAMAEIRQQLLDHPYDLVLTTSSRKFGGDPAEYAAVWAPIAAAGSRIAVLADNPEVSEESLACLTRPSFGGDKTGDCGTPKAEALATPDPLVAAAGRVPNAKLIDLTQYYCTADRCPSVIGDVIVYRDNGSHITATYFATLAPAIVDGIRRALVA
jgi:peptidoglycan/LPS O-acetylase OafA/YrhL